MISLKEYFIKCSFYVLNSYKMIFLLISLSFLHNVFDSVYTITVTYSYKNQCLISAVFFFYRAVS
ncbi:hypothetical protein FO501_24770 [Bacillus pacificus]|nr:hypothetical protein [Bacillus pacificus]